MAQGAPQPQRAAATASVEERVEVKAELTAPAANSSASSPVSPVKFEEAVQALEKQLLEAALAAEKGHQRKAADRLGLSYHQMRGLLRKYGYGRHGDLSETQPPTDPPT
jgi:psp operon transcriptional activator